LFLQTGDGEDSHIRAIFDTCREHLPNQTVTVALGGRALPAKELRAATKKANTVLQSGAVFASSSFLLQETPPVHYSKEDISALCKLLRSGEEAKAGRLLQQLLRRCQENTCTQADLATILKQILQGCGKEDLQMEADYHVGLLLEQSRNYEILLKNMESLLFQPGNHSEFKLNDKSSRAIIDTVAAHLAAHASEKISLQAVAEEFGFNYTYLSYLFKKSLGKSPSEYLTQCRIDQAKRLLTQSEEHSIKEISSAVGYDDPYYFSRIFKTTTGMSPSEYRKQHAETI
jgi:AraC-like DNA-binding protein